jgi:hypothetical protein
VLSLSEVDGVGPVLGLYVGETGRLATISNWFQTVTKAIWVMGFLLGKNYHLNAFAILTLASL